MNYMFGLYLISLKFGGGVIDLTFNIYLDWYRFGVPTMDVFVKLLSRMKLSHDIYIYI